ncbi:beta-lactamase family protein [Flavobacteriaceae bacterium]|jgi:CubicO group peptidase (beta-lactamase class C family)|nr:beta-lactamase family protein [Flavobacteriaceae bacterium]MDA8644484.1 beta-lactamase family protein [Flavobacteriaceae bacterium]MDC0386010.1 beta-lactamase family protein [Flavobacteriaceae bacterium]
MKKILYSLGFTLLILVGVLYISDYSYLLRAVSKIYFTGHSTAFLSDYTRFDNHILPASENPQAWPLHKNYNEVNLSEDLEAFHKKTQTVAFVLIKNDSVYLEKYYDNYGSDSKSNSFSVAKSFVSALLGKAIMDGYIQSLDQKVIDFIPEIKGPYADLVTVGDLASMASGQRWDEAYYSPLSVTTAAYFVEDLGKLILTQPIDEVPGIEFIYKSGTTQLLGMVISKATGKNLTDYLYETLWNPMGAEHESFWQVDSAKKGLEKAYCCIASNAKDFARLAKLYKDHGKWNGKVLLDSTFVTKSIQPRFPESPEYGYSWWLKEYKGHKVFMMRGHLGQYVITFPEENLILVRLGHTKGPKGSKEDPFTPDIYTYMDAALELNPNAG